MKEITGYEGLYAVTSCGKVWSYKNNRFLKSAKTKAGYLQVQLCKDSKPKTYYVHRLVAQQYLSNVNNLSEVNHKNEIKTDNRLQNLEWCDAKYNSNYGTRTMRCTAHLRKNLPN